MERRLLPIASCMDCIWFTSQKDCKKGYYRGYCTHETNCSDLDIPFLERIKRRKKLLWNTGATQCVVSSIPDWCPLEKENN